MTPIDRYTKFVLTLIALALIVIATRLYFAPASAGAEEMGRGCGYDTQHPCFVEGWGPSGTMPVVNSVDTAALRVLVVNPPAAAVPVFTRNPGR